MAAAGIIDPAKTLYASNRFIWLSALVGGALFGFGMVLASGCGSKTLVRIGGGSLKSVVVFAVMGIAAFATLKGITAVVRVATVDKVALDFTANASLPNWVAGAIGITPAAAGIGLAILIGMGLIVWALFGEEFRRFDNLLAGLGTGGVIAAMWWVSGHLGYVAEHPETLQEAFIATNSGPGRGAELCLARGLHRGLADVLQRQEQGAHTGHRVGVRRGSRLGCLRLAVAQFPLGRFSRREDTANHLVGATLMGVGGVCAMGCTVGQGLSGISTLSLTSFVALAAILAGCVAGLKYQIWRLERAA